MTQRDYVKFASLIAGELALARNCGGNWLQERIVNNFKLSIADIFANDNKRFNREEFYRACEPKANVR